MNDRAAGGSAYNNGTIEIMINRKVSNASDELGNEERLSEFEAVYKEGFDPSVDAPEFKFVQVNPRFKVRFTNSRYQAFNIIRDNYLREHHSIYLMYTNTEP